MNTDLTSRTRPTNDGHLLWTGATHEGAPVFHIGGKRYRSAAALVYSQHHQRPPVGRVTSTCDRKGCVLPAHLADQDERQEAYRRIAEERGKPTIYGYCNQGHAWADSAVFCADGTRGCRDCRRRSPAVSNTVGIELTLAGRPEELSRLDQLEAARRLICNRGASHDQTARLVGRSSRTVTRWAVQNKWKKPVAA